MEEQFLADLERLHDSCGPWDIVLFTGDLTQRGSAREFDRFNEQLGVLWKHMKRLGSEPVLLAVPGNHDLTRPKPTRPEMKALLHYHTDQDVRNEFWNRASSPYRKLVTKAFANYCAWWASHPFPRLSNFSGGLLPGDFSASIEKGGYSLGIVGLNSAFLQLSAMPAQGLLDLDVLQLHAACPNGLKWINSRSLCLLLTHHPPDWLRNDSQSHLNGEIAPPERFALHLFGHLHENVSKDLSLAGAGVWRHRQACSLFGLEYYGDSPRVRRRHGYCAARLCVSSDAGLFREWPRSAHEQQTKQLALVADPSYRLELDSGTREARIPIRRSNLQRQATHVVLQPPGASYDEAWYVPRSEPEDQAFSYLHGAGSPVVLRGPRAFGKTWLFEQIIRRLRNSSPKSLILRIDLALLDAECRRSATKFFRHLAQQVVEGNGGNPALVANDWRGPGTPASKLKRIFERRVFSSLKAGAIVVLAVDQADSIWGLPFQNDFFGMLRAWASLADEPWTALRLLLAVSTTPVVLVADERQSPFNLVPSIELRDLAPTEIGSLARLYGLNWTTNETRRLTQLLRLAMYEAAANSVTIDSLADPAFPAYEAFLQRYRTWLLKHESLLSAAKALWRDPAASIDPALRYRLDAAGLIRGEPGIGYRPRYSLYERLFQ